MPISNIVIIVMRIFGLQWIASGLLGLIAIFAVDHGHNSTGEIGFSLLSLLLGAFVWVVAAAIARLATRGYDCNISIAGLTLTDLYSFAFIFLGLYFMLSNLAALLTWFYYSLKIASASDNDPERSRSLYSLVRYAITVAAGAACLYNGRRWATKLAVRDTQG